MNVEQYTKELWPGLLVISRHDLPQCILRILFSMKIQSRSISVTRCAVLIGPDLSHTDTPGLVACPSPS